MKGRYGGPMSVDDLFQALWQDRAFFKKHGITHVRAAFLYFTPCNQDGLPVTIIGEDGRIMDEYISAGAYHSVAAFYDAGTLEPQAVSRPRLTL